MKSSFCIDLQRFMLIPTKFPLNRKIRIKQNLLSCKDTREEKEFHPKYFSIYRKSSESIQKVRSRRNHLSEDDSKAA